MAFRERLSFMRSGFSRADDTTCGLAAIDIVLWPRVNHEQYGWPHRPDRLPEIAARVRVRRRCVKRIIEYAHRRFK